MANPRMNGSDGKLKIDRRRPTAVLEGSMTGATTSAAVVKVTPGWYLASQRALPLRCSKSPDRKAADCISLAAADREKPPSCTWPEAFGAVAAVFQDISARGVLPLIVLRPSPKRTATLCCALTSLGK